MGEATTTTMKLVDAVRGVKAEDLPAEAVEIAKQVCLDGMAVMLAGSTEPLGLGRLVTAWVAEQGGTPESSVIAGGVKVPAMAAAFANGTMAHALDFDNFWHPRNHPTSPTLPAILALAEKYGFDGQQIIGAINVALEVQVRLRMASEGLELGKGFHKPGTTGIMGATAACGWLLELDRTQMAMALGIAGSRAGSFSINTGTMTKSSHSGHAARMGVECAELAKRGWTASEGVFDAGGFFDTIVGDKYDASLLTDGFAAPFYAVEHGIGFKKHPCNGFTQRPIDAALELRQEHKVDPADIDKIVIDVPPFDYVNRPLPKTGLDGKFSIQYTTAIAMLDGYVFVDSFSDERRFAPDVEDLLPRVSLKYDDNIPLGALETYIRLNVHLKDGTVLVNEKQKITGMVGVPLSQDEREHKYFACADRVLSRSRAEELLELVNHLDQASDVTAMLALASQADH